MVWIDLWVWGYVVVLVDLVIGLVCDVNLVGMLW